MVRPAGPRISSIRVSTLSAAMKPASSFWVCSNDPMIDPAPDMPETNSTISSSTTCAETLPSPAMAWDTSLISSSSRCRQIASWSSPSDSRITAAFSGPDSRPASTIDFALALRGPRLIPRRSRRGYAGQARERLLTGPALRCLGEGGSCGLMQPAAEDRDRLFGVLVHELGDRPHRGSLHLALDARDVDLLLDVGAGQGERLAPRVGALTVGRRHQTRHGWPAGERDEGRAGLRRARRRCPHHRTQ